MNNSDGLGILLLLIVVFLAGAMFGGGIASDRYRSAAVKRGFAQYNQTTGSWEWKESIKK